MRWIKENPTLAAGIGLPLLLIALFGFASTIPKMLVPAPTYDLLFHTEHYTGNPTAMVNVSVANGKIRLQYIRNTSASSGYNKVVYRYSAKNNVTRQITITPPDLGSMEWQDFSVDSLANLTLDTNFTAPDGYTFENQRSGGGGDIAELFFMNGHRYRGPLIAKDGRSISIQPASDTYYGYNTHFLGWIIEE